MNSSYGRSKGFTLIEVVVVIAVVAILAAILTPTITKYLEDSRRSRALNEATVYGAAVANFFKDTGRWPTSTNGTNDAFDILRAGDGSGSAPTAGDPQWDDDNGNTDATVSVQLILNDLDNDDIPKEEPPAGYTNLGNSAWRGPYTDQDNPDPWNRFYYINVGAWNHTVGDIANGIPDYIWVISAGPNQTIDTAVDPDGGGAPAAPASDDIGFRIR